MQWKTQAYGQISELTDKLAQEKLYLEDEIRTEANFEEIVGKSQALHRVLKLVETVAPTGSTVLICGETGTGKELIARAIHDLSSRNSKTFVKLNCAALPAGLLESELFGHEKGAFTGAIAQRIGRLELANHGTLFLSILAEVDRNQIVQALKEAGGRVGGRDGAAARLGLKRTTFITRMKRLGIDPNQSSKSFRTSLLYRTSIHLVLAPAVPLSKV